MGVFALASGLMVVHVFGCVWLWGGGWCFLAGSDAGLAGWFSGWLFDEDKFKDEPMRLYAFMFSLGVLLITTTLTIIKDGNK